MILITCLCRRTFFVGDKKCADDICLHAGDILGGQNGDFMLPKLNNRLVNRRLSRNSAFLLHSWQVFSLEKTIALIRFCKKMTTRWPKWRFLESCKPFSISLQSASNHDQPHQLTVLESESHELFKKAIKKLSFDWYGGLPAGFIIWKISNFYFGHQLVKMVRTGKCFYCRIKILVLWVNLHP